MSQPERRLDAQQVSNWAHELELGAGVAQSSDARKHVDHLLLSFHPQEAAMDVDGLIRLSEGFLEKMGYTEKARPFVAYLHEDKEHRHVHILTTPYDEAGRRVVNDFRSKKRAVSAARELRAEFGLEDVPMRAAHGPDARREISLAEREISERLNLEPAREAFQRSIERVGRGAGDWEGFVRGLQGEGFEVRFRFRQSDGQPTGVSFGREGARFSGSQLGRGYTFRGLDLAFELGYRDDQAGVLKSLVERPASQRQATGPKTVVDKAVSDDAMPPRDLPLRDLANEEAPVFPDWVMAADLEVSSVEQTHLNALARLPQAPAGSDVAVLEAQLRSNGLGVALDETAQDAVLSTLARGELPRDGVGGLGADEAALSERMAAHAARARLTEASIEGETLAIERVAAGAIGSGSRADASYQVSLSRLIELHGSLERAEVSYSQAAVVLHRQQAERFATLLWGSSGEASDGEAQFPKWLADVDRHLSYQVLLERRVGERRLPESLGVEVGDALVLRARERSAALDSMSREALWRVARAHLDSRSPDALREALSLRADFHDARQVERLLASRLGGSRQGLSAEMPADSRAINRALSSYVDRQIRHGQLEDGFLRSGGALSQHPWQSVARVANGDISVSSLRELSTALLRDRLVDMSSVSLPRTGSRMTPAQLYQAMESSSRDLSTLARQVVSGRLVTPELGQAMWERSQRLLELHRRFSTAMLGAHAIAVPQFSTASPEVLARQLLRMTAAVQSLPGGSALHHAAGLALAPVRLAGSLSPLKALQMAGSAVVRAATKAARIAVQALGHP
jgi:hypothetical protein